MGEHRFVTGEERIKVPPAMPRKGCGLKHFETSGVDIVSVIAPRDVHPLVLVEMNPREVKYRMLRPDARSDFHVGYAGLFVKLAPGSIVA